MRSLVLSLVAVCGLASQTNACDVAVSGLCAHNVVAVQQAVVTPFVVQQSVVQAHVAVQPVGVVQVLAAPVVAVKNVCVRAHCGVRAARVKVLGGGRQVIRQRSVIRSR